MHSECEFRMRNLILASLAWDPGRQHARSINHDVPALGLLKGDRLEPHAGCMDYAKFDWLTAFPARVLFWRRKRETLCRHRNPLFNNVNYDDNHNYDDYYIIL